MSIERLHFTNQHDVLEFLSVQMAAFIVEANIIGYLEQPPYMENQMDLLTSHEVFWGYYVHAGDQKKLAGAISYCSDLKIAKIMRLVVDPSYFRRGIGKALMTYVIQQLEELGYHEVQVIAASQNIPAIQLYTSFAFSPEDTIMLHQGIPLLVFKKMLYD
jgi:ribosomal protein S18 acetylase RimI-like enzyme